MAFKIDAPANTSGNEMYGPRPGESKTFAVLPMEPYQRQVVGNDGKSRFTVGFAVVQQGARDAQLYNANAAIAKQLEKIQDKLADHWVKLVRPPNGYAAAEIDRPMTQEEFEDFGDVPHLATVQDMVDPVLSDDDCPIG